MVWKETSPHTHEFVQRCQVSACLSAARDHASRFSELCTALRTFPMPSEAIDLSVSCGCLLLIANGFFAPREQQPVTGIVVERRRWLVNAVLSTVLREYPRRDVALAAIAQHLDTTRPYLSRALRQETGHVFASHVSLVRLLAVVRLLGRDTEQIKHAALTVGFSTTGELDRQMGRWFHISPSLFKAAINDLPAIVRAGLPSH